MALINLQDVSISFGGDPILDRVNLQIEPGERVCLIGRNGEGKSTLMKLLNNELMPDHGRIIGRRGIRIARLAQEVPAGLTGTVYDVVAGGIEKLMGLLSRHHNLAGRLAHESTAELISELAELDQELETCGAWNVQQQIDTVLSRLQLDADQVFADFSGGMKRRVMLARALVCDPDLLLLDEPTNHLDIEAITWLEEFLLASSGTLLFVTHDRELLKKLATRIIDLDRGTITSWPGDYDTYLKRKDEMLAAETNQRAHFDKKLAQEEIWIRQGIKARRTRNQGRVRALLELRDQHRARRERLGKARMEINAAGLSGKLVAMLKDVSYRYPDDNAMVIKELSTTILRGDKIGLIGPNGSGKTTLLKLLLGELSPSHGDIRLGTRIMPAYFDQQRAQLNEEKSVIDNLGEGNDFIEMAGRHRHIIGYLRDFLFTPDRARSPVKILSGGERNRLLLAKLFARPSNILILDEPTNDLDLETLELLEELLLEYSGTVLVVSHDRTFLNDLVTSSLVFEGNGRVIEYAGGYDDWLRQRPAINAVPERIKPKSEASKKRLKPRPDRPRKLTFKEVRELENLPTAIEEMEKEQQALYDTMADPAFYQGDGAAVSSAKARLEELAELLLAVYSRWEELETIKDEIFQSKKNMIM